MSTAPRTAAVRRAVPAARPVRRPRGDRPRGPVRTAVADIAPVVLGVLPLGMSVGIAARAAAVAPATGLGTALLMFGGAANLAASSLSAALARRPHARPSTYGQERTMVKCGSGVGGELGDNREFWHRRRSSGRYRGLGI